jgi:hypothetical protein
MSSKIRLDLDALAVESFATSTEMPRHGTVFARALSDSTCVQRICTCGESALYGSCEATCGNTCQVSCEGTCDQTCAGCGEAGTSAGPIICSCIPVTSGSL